MKQRWISKGKKIDFTEICNATGVTPIMAWLIVNRGYKTIPEIQEYLGDSMENIPSPWLLKDMDRAVEILLGGEWKVAISSDFDCDGIFAGYILQSGLRELGIANELYTPDRVAEGYGINRRIIDEAKKKGANLILTCDNGIAAKEEIAYAKEQGLTVIVTDHHDVQGAIPQADAVVNPKQEDCPYPFKGICGAVVAYKLVQALYEKRHVSSEKLEKLLPFAAMATITDVMDLAKENRTIVKNGLKKLRETSNLGLLALMRAQGITPRDIRSYHIGFVIGPCFNASGRLATVKEALELLDATDEKEADRLAIQLKELNDTRKTMTEEGTERAIKIVEATDWEEEKVLTVYLPDCHESLVGIIAGRVRERFARPTIVFTDAEGDNVKGSGRSVEIYNMFEELYQCKDLFEHFGGHPMAAGITMPKSNLEELHRRLTQQCKLMKEQLCQIVEVDMELPVHFATKQLVDELVKLEPLGKGNTKPVFMGKHFRILRGRKLGKMQNVLSMLVQDDRGTKIEAIMFRDVDRFEDFLEDEYGQAEIDKMYRGQENEIDVAFTYYPSVNTYNGYETMQLQISGYCHMQGRDSNGN